MGDQGDDALAQVPAEVAYAPGKKTSAARALQQLGFRILNIDDTISVSAPAHVWTSTFGVSFAERSRQRGATIPTDLEPDSDELDVPAGLRELVADVFFVPPPEYFST